MISLWSHTEARAVSGSKTTGDPEIRNDSCLPGETTSKYLIRLELSWQDFCCPRTREWLCGGLLARATFCNRNAGGIEFLPTHQSKRWVKSSTTRSRFMARRLGSGGANCSQGSAHVLVNGGSPCRISPQGGRFSDNSSKLNYCHGRDDHH